MGIFTYQYPLHRPFPSVGDPLASTMRARITRMLGMEPRTSYMLGRRSTK